MKDIYIDIFIIIIIIIIDIIIPTIAVLAQDFEGPAQLRARDELAFWMWVVASFLGEIYLLSSFLAQKFRSSSEKPLEHEVELFMTKAGRKLHKRRCRILAEDTILLEICGDCCQEEQSLDWICYVEDGAKLHESQMCPKIMARCKVMSLCAHCHYLKKLD